MYNTFLKTLDNILEEPLLYVGSKNLKCIYSFFSGFSVGGCSHDEDLFWEEFTKFVSRKYDVNKWEALNWASIIEYYANYDEETAFKIFSEDIKCFLKRNKYFIKEKEKCDFDTCPTVNDLHSLIDLSITKPYLMVGYPSVQRLYAMINGFLIGNKFTDDVHFMDSFNTFIKKKYNVKNDAKWPIIIRVQNIGMDDKRAFEIFSKDYYEFLSQAFNS